MKYIKLSRKILEWEWWHDINTCRLFIHMLLKANWKEGKFQGKVIPRGSFVSSLPKLSEETQLTIREVRTAISHLKSTGEVTCKSYSKFTVFTVNNYCLYQASDTQNDRQVTDKRHSNDILTTTIEEKKEVKNNSDGVDARAIATNLLTTYWGRLPTEADIEKVRCIVTRVNREEKKLFIDTVRSELLEYAFDCSSKAGCLNWNYVRGVLDRLESRGLNNIDDAYQYDIDRKS